MKTIVEPKQYIIKLWGKQQFREDTTYRLMRYLLRVDYEEKVLLHNVITGQLVFLDSDEAEVLDELPKAYTPVMEHLISAHYLVPEDFDEFEQVSNLRKVLQKFDEVHTSKGFINHYTILPTTTCNARCYYCFEQGVPSVTMSESTADDVVMFIKSHCKGKSVFLSWFGGEPTLAVERIDQICSKLRYNGVDFSSEITTNGYLFNEELAKKAKDLWKLKSAMICVDGTEESYNRTKCFVYKKGNPYQVVMRNIGLLLAQNIHVQLRMNFDIGNYNEFDELVAEIKERFQLNDQLVLSAHPVLGEHVDYTGTVHHGASTWFESMYVELNDIANDAGLQKRNSSLSSLRHRVCMAASDSSVTITANGKLVSCPEKFDEDEWKGNLKDGITNPTLVEAWKEKAVFDKCRSCVVFPACMPMLHCLTAGNCGALAGILKWQKELSIQKYKAFVDGNTI